MRTGALPACLLTTVDVGAALTLYAALHGWRWASLPSTWAAELSALDKHTGTADLLLIALVRSVANALAPVAFPRASAPRREFDSAFEELRHLWPDTWRLLRREFPVFVTWGAALLCAAYTALRFGEVVEYARQRGGGAAVPPLAWALLACGSAACLACLILVGACAAAAAAVRHAAPSPAAPPDPERGLSQPLLSDYDGADGDAAAAAAQRIKRTSLWRLIALSAPDKWMAIGAFVFLVLAVCCDVAIPSFKSEALTAILEHHATAKVLGAAAAAPGDDFRRAMLSLAVVSAGAGLFSGARGGLLSVCNFRLVKRLQEQLYGRLIRKDIASLDALSTGKLLSRLTTDTALVGDVLGLNLNVAFRSLLRLVLTVGYLATLDVELTCVALGSSLAFFAVTFFFSRFQRVSSKAAQEATADSNHVAEQSLSLARTVRAFCAEAWEERRFREVLASRLGVQEKQSAAYALFTVAFGILDNAQSVVLLLVGGRRYAVGAVDAAVLSKFVFYSGVISASVQSIADMVGDLFKALGASEEVFRLLDEPIAVLPDDDSPPCADASCVPGGPSARAAVRFEAVHFSYPSRPGALVLNGVDLRIEPGQQVALVGLSGSGKSTMIQLLLRLYDADAGRITFNQHDITAVSLRWLRRMMGVVGQEPPLFSVSLWRNIAYADSSFSDDDVAAAAGLACATSFIEAMPEKYDTLVGPKGVQLSGGQKQRIAIARAVIRNPPLLILDEATSALDAESEHAVQCALERAMRGRSVLVVAHRLSTIRNADVIVVMRHGVVVETGTHAALLAARGAYHALVQGQLANASGDDGGVGGACTPAPAPAPALNRASLLLRHAEAVDERSPSAVARRGREGSSDSEGSSCGSDTASSSAALSGAAALPRRGSGSSLTSSRGRSSPGPQPGARRTGSTASSRQTARPPTTPLSGSRTAGSPASSGSATRGSAPGAQRPPQPSSLDSPRSSGRTPGRGAPGAGRDS